MPLHLPLYHLKLPEHLTMQMQEPPLLKVVQMKELRKMLMR